GGDGYSFTTIAGPTITNVTTPAIENTQATIAWRTNVAADSEIVYSTNATLVSPLTASDATELTDHSLTLTNLSLGTRYYFKIRSGTATDTNSGHYYTFVTTSDATPPVISGVTADPITDTEAVLQWQTNEKSTSRVRYGTSHGTFTVEVPENLTLNLSHSVTLKNLTPDSTYHVAVESADAAGNRTTGDEYDFVTLEKLTPESEVVGREDRARAENSDATAPAITGLVVSDVTDAAAAVTWQTNETANSFVEFGPAGSEPIIYGNWVFVTDHTISLTALAASTTYQYRVVSVDESGNVATTSQATFTTAAPSTVGLESRLEQEYERLLDQGKSVPIPVIGGEPRVEVAPTSATVTWTTDKPANGFVAVASATDYQSDRREPYVQIVGDPERYGSRHTVTLSNLLPDTVYHYQVRSRTTVSEVAQTRDATFRTPKRTFAIDNYVVEKMNESEAIFRWTTTDEATAMVKFIPYRNNIRAVDEVQIVRVDAYTVIHQVSVTRFEPGVKYDVELISAQRNGSLASRTIDAFSTEAVTTPPSINGIAVDTALSAGEKVKVQTIVSWSTNKPTTGRVTYRKGVAKNDDPFTESSPVDANYTKKHVIVLTTLEPGTVYQYRVESTDSAGQVSVSKPMTILTPQQQRTVFQVIFDTVQDTFGWARLFNR
ncbi:MAG: fibronectin type III domain-containing protein, partial [Candidatus Kerfeldbacteria bacterium]|nr:fibronectin type III domain-containing protein [Candidatus Kerfeldbacteria bacterium]